MSSWLGNLLSRIFRDLVAQFRPDVNRSYWSRSTRRRTTRTSSDTGQHPSGSRRIGGSGRCEYPGDLKGILRITHSLAPGEETNPGEVAWTWVPCEEDHRDGRDRPVLIIGRDYEWLLGLLPMSKDHGRDAAQETRCGRLWMDIGMGEWDPQRRPNEVRINRTPRIDPDGVRRIGTVLNHEVFEVVAVVVWVWTSPNRIVAKVWELTRGLSG